MIPRGGTVVASHDCMKIHNATIRRYLVTTALRRAVVVAAAWAVIAYAMTFAVRQHPKPMTVPTHFAKVMLGLEGR